MYFNSFPNTRYLVSPATRGKQAEYATLVDITRNVRFKKEVLDNIAVYDYFTMSDDDTIEHVSENLYGSPYYHWVLMLLNDRYDYVRDLPMPSRAFEHYIEQKYPKEYIETEYGQFEGARGLIVDLKDANGNSIDFVEQMNVNGSLQTVSSVSKYDPVIGTDVKVFYGQDGTPLPTNANIDFGGVPHIERVFAYDAETASNESKRRIKVISEAILSTVLRNFKDLM